MSFNRDIRPILSENCLACHGPDKHSRQADLRLDERASAVESGAIVPHQVSRSRLVDRIESTDDELVMPPPKTGKKLSDRQRALLKQWIEEGAPFETHWSFSPVPKQVPVPDVGELASWANGDLDRFVAAQWLQRGLQPAEEASPRQWLRRVSFDLSGLPPTLEELNQFEQDHSANRYQKVVDRLLSSEAYGERMANLWLDVARYADTYGYQSDVAMEVWPWRDWVIRAFNDNVSYDQFVIWQTAGDLLPNPTIDQRLATTFNRLHRQTNEGGSIVEEFRVANVADRTTTNGTAFLGLTLECSRCHDHKYDPILQKDFYRLSAHFADIDELGVYSHFTHGVPTPALLLYQGDQHERHEHALNRVRQFEEEWTGLRNAVAEEYRSGKIPPVTKWPEVPQTEYHFPLEGDAEGVFGQGMLCDGDEEIPFKEVPEFGRCDPFTISLWVKPALAQPRMIVAHQSVAAEDSAFRGWQLTLDDGRPEFSLIHFWPGDAVRVESTAELPLGDWSLLTVTHDGSGRASGLRIFVNGELREVTVERDQLTRDIRHRKEWGDMKVGEVKLALAARFRDIGFRGGVIDDLKVFTRQLTSLEVEAIYHAAQRNPHAQEQGPRTDLAQEHAIYHDSRIQEALDRLLAARRLENDIVTEVRAVMTMRKAIVPQATHFLHRGEYHARGERVEPGIPAFLASLHPDKVIDDRLKLARWMTDENNPLLSRVIANRFWHLFFGRGIVASLEDFGSQGTPPSHPELLDWLARSLIDNGWDLKDLCRRIVLSSTYRQSSIPRDPALYASDPENILLARGPKHRLTAEQVRDAALAASGLLVRKLGGPSVMPYQPVGLWEEAGTGKSYNQAKGEGLYRRSLYTFWRRTAPPPSMLTFDATSRETCTPKREPTTTPLQALVLLNDPQYVEAARTLAEQLVRRHGDDLSNRWSEMFNRLVTRPPTNAELEIVRQLYAEQLEYFQENPERATAFLEVGDRTADRGLPSDQLAATTVVVESLFSFDETMMKR